MSYSSYIFYIQSRFKKEEMKRYQEEYNSNLLYSVAQTSYKLAQPDSRGIEGLKPWTEIVGSANEAKDDRTAKEIEDDTLALFKRD